MPTNADWDVLGYTSESLVGKPKTVESKQVRDDRQVSDLIKTGLEVNGGVEFEFKPDNLDDLLEAAFYSTFTGGVLEPGQNKQSFSIEKKFADISGSNIMRFLGMVAGSLNLSFSHGEIVTGSVSFMGTGYSLEASHGIGTGSLLDTSDEQAYNAAGQLGTIQVDGSSTGLFFKKIDLSVDNGLRPKDAVGSDAPVDINAGTIRITGTIEAYFDDVSLLNALVDNTDISFNWTVSDGTTSYTFLLPKIKFSDGIPTGEGLDGDTMQSLTFTALYDAGEGTSARVTKA
jgi:hypothetical protein